MPGDNIYKAVDVGVRLWDKVLLCASQASLTSGWVDWEIDTAIEKEMTLKKERGTEVLAIIPLNLDGHLFEWDNPHAAALRKRFSPDFTGWEKDNAKFEAQLEQIVKALQTQREPPPKPKL